MKNTKEMTRYAIYIAIITLFAQIPQLGFITIGVVGVTTLPIIVVPMILIENNWKATFTISITWGINAWLAAVLRGSTPIELWFRNPLVGLVPRVLAGLIAYAAIRQLIKLNKIIKVGNVEFWSRVVAALISISLTLVALMMPTGGNDILKWFWIAIGALIGLGIGYKLLENIKSNKKAGANLIIGLFSGALIALIHTTIVLVSIKLFVSGEDELVQLMLDYVIKTSGIIELLVTAFITMSVYPSLANIKVKKVNKLKRA